MYPFYAAHTVGAKLLHFNGPYKPWDPVPDLLGRTSGKQRDARRLCKTSVCPLVAVRNMSEYAQALRGGLIPTCASLWRRYSNCRGECTRREERTWAWLHRTAREALATPHATANASNVTPSPSYLAAAALGEGDSTADADAVDALWMHYCSRWDCLPASSCRCQEQRGQRICQFAARRLLNALPRRAFTNFTRGRSIEHYSNWSSQSRNVQFQCPGWRQATANFHPARVAGLVNRLPLGFASNATAPSHAPTEAPTEAPTFEPPVVARASATASPGESAATFEKKQNKLQGFNRTHSSEKRLTRLQKVAASLARRLKRAQDAKQAILEDAGAQGEAPDPGELRDSQNAVSVAALASDAAEAALRRLVEGGKGDRN